MITINLYGMSDNNGIIKMPMSSSASVVIVDDVKGFLCEILDIDIESMTLKERGKSLNDGGKELKKGSRLLCIVEKRGDDDMVTDAYDRMDCIGWKRDCDFYGITRNDGYCSMCYKRKRRCDSREKKKEIKIKKELESVESVESVNDIILQSDIEHCWKCKKRVGLLGFGCKCGYKFCGKHRYYDMHDCCYDIKKSKDDLRNKLSKCVLESKKINRF